MNNLHTGVHGEHSPALAFERLHFAEAHLARRRQSNDHPGETQRLAMRFVLERTADGEAVMPATLGAFLGITSASVSILLDRLIRDGMVTVRPHPTDRRRRLVLPVDATDDPDVVDPITAAMRELDADLTSNEAALISSYLDRVTTAVREECP